ncbi:hypothetical protein [Paractinoplanes maris]|uniref:hypothetical protein n=1 Tax=Paractinoplanes maris TaxID=1734446 RepID=UPI0020227355|nr:hypothetical protein [Actinoplanes maris]
MTILGLAGGFVLGERQRDEDRASGAGSESATEPTESSEPGFTPPGPWCPDAARRKAKETGHTSELWQILKVYADRTNSTWWICTDAQGGLYYQSWTNVGKPLVQGTNGLFLPGVERVGKDSYKVEAPDGNVFAISPTTFSLTYAKKGTEPQRDEVRRID